MKFDKVLKLAHEALKNAYAPYSKFSVGACVKTKDSKYFIGSNVENASYGLTNCAERNAIFQAYSNGYRKEDIEVIAIYSDSLEIITPCGACRQVLVELLQGDTLIILANKDKIIKTNIKELMPMAFTSNHLTK